MPAPKTDIVRKPVQATITVALEPVHHLINSLLLLDKADELSGYAAWVTDVAKALSPEVVERNRLVLLGLHYAVVPRRRWHSFPDYLEDMANCDPSLLVKRVLDAYESMASKDGGEVTGRSQALTSEQAYLDYLYGRFPAELIDESIEREAYALMIDPPAMQQTIVAHLSEMWQRYLQPEWERIEPMMRASVDAFRVVDFTQMTPMEAAKSIVGQELPEHWEWSFNHQKLEQVIFVPSAHVGPYLGTFKQGATMWLLFGARLPEGAAVASPDLDRSQLLVQLSALADDNRLHILQLIHDEGELCSQEIINRLELSQSAASRHLKQLSATGYLSERRRDGAKCYSLNRERVETVLQALSYFLTR